MGWDQNGNDKETGKSKMELIQKGMGQKEN